ncbi:MAG: DUF2281 domain-containing protein [Gomphosphaeria aponina SAG 52.96 = DSM 107014]|uniref:DUF2281 domain-containing protein n=1 Tax=Gomphosphaeria aponina SAG 52.96 = DSM 107014 TaxID=1521640 RepID=A0A941GNK1_9CHRO|nr:DUF2281 domain-containing protein [Gomphosphaeria aponina SAG 52.96 = DSM 107014]
MNLEQSLLEKVGQLPVDKKLELLDFAEFLYQKSIPQRPSKSIKGLCADLKVDITEEDIKELRKEMWGSFTE